MFSHRAARYDAMLVCAVRVWRLMMLAVHAIASRTRREATPHVLCHFGFAVSRLVGWSTPRQLHALSHYNATPPNGCSDTTTLAIHHRFYPDDNGN